VRIQFDSILSVMSSVTCAGCLQIAGTPDQTLTALKMITDKLRAVTPAPDGDRMHHDYRDNSPVDKRSRGEGPPPGAGHAMSLLLFCWQCGLQHGFCAGVRQSVL
jgi:hypothetical protein